MRGLVHTTLGLTRDNISGSDIDTMYVPVRKGFPDERITGPGTYLRTHRGLRKDIPLVIGTYLTTTSRQDRVHGDN